MKKNQVPPWIIVICIFGVFFVLFSIGKEILGYNNFKYDVDINGTILIGKEKFSIEPSIKSFYDTESNSFYIEGIITNNSKKTYYGIELLFLVYDLDENILGTAHAFLEKIDSKQSWKFKANYTDIDAIDAVSYKLIDVEYY